MESLDNATDDQNFREERSILEMIQVENLLVSISFLRLEQEGKI